MDVLVLSTFELPCSTEWELDCLRYGMGYRELGNYNMRIETSKDIKG